MRLLFFILIFQLWRAKWTTILRLSTMKLQRKMESVTAHYIIVCIAQIGVHHAPVPSRHKSNVGDFGINGGHLATHNGITRRQFYDRVSKKNGMSCYDAATRPIKKRKRR